MPQSDFLHNEEVTLASDPAFRGYFAGSTMPDADGPRVILVVKVPSKSGYRLHANKPFLLADVRPLSARSRK